MIDCFTFLTGIKFAPNLYGFGFMKQDLNSVTFAYYMNKS